MDLSRRWIRPIPREAELEEGEIPTTSPKYKVDLFWSGRDGGRGQCQHITQLAPLEFDEHQVPKCMIPMNGQQLFIALWINFQMMRHTTEAQDDTININSSIENLNAHRSMQQQQITQTQKISVNEFLSKMYHYNMMVVPLVDFPIIAVFTPLG